MSMLRHDIMHVTAHRGSIMQLSLACRDQIEHAELAEPPHLAVAPLPDQHRADLDSAPNLVRLHGAVFVRRMRHNELRVHGVALGALRL